MDDFTEKLKRDLVEQFKQQPNIEAVIEAVGAQLQEVSSFFEALRVQRSLRVAVGAQLDGAGDIVSLTRAEAGRLASVTNPGEAITDDLYRRYLIYKVLKNTNVCTYPEIIKAFKMFWDKPLYYSEDPTAPATMVFKTDVLAPGDAPEKLLGAPIIKAAGVGIRIIAETETPVLTGAFSVSPVLARGYTITRLPEIEPDFDFSRYEHFTAVAHNVTKTILPEIKEA